MVTLQRQQAYARLKVFYSTLKRQHNEQSKAAPTHQIKSIKGSQNFPLHLWATMFSLALNIHYVAFVPA